MRALKTEERAKYWGFDSIAEYHNLLSEFDPQSGRNKSLLESWSCYDGTKNGLAILSARGKRTDIYRFFCSKQLGYLAEKEEAQWWAKRFRFSSPSVNMVQIKDKDKALSLLNGWDSRECPRHDLIEIFRKPLSPYEGHEDTMQKLASNGVAVVCEYLANPSSKYTTKKFYAPSRVGALTVTDQYFRNKHIFGQMQ